MPAITQSISADASRFANSLSLEISGMSCASCVGRLERAIKSVPGVERVAVNLATERAEVSFWSGQRDTRSVIKAVASAGYTPGVLAMDLQIEGMTCASCVSRIETALRRIPDVLECQVNLLSGRAHVRAVAGAVSMASLV